MNFKKEFNALVILGNWNNTIINPEWINNHILPETQWNVEIPLNINASLRMSTDELRIFSIDGKLNFAVLKHSDDVFTKIGELGVKIADKLIHTPVSAFGINFVFESDPTEPLDELFTLNDLENFTEKGFDVTNTNIKRQLKSGDKIINLNIVKIGNKYTLDFNYHTGIKSLVEFKDKFDTENMVVFKNEAVDLLNDLYGLELEE